MSTLLNEKGHNPDVIEHLLSHQGPNKVRAAYNRAEYLSERRITLQWLADHLDSLYTKAQLREAITLKNEAFKREEKTLYDSTKDFLTTKIYLE